MSLSSYQFQPADVNPMLGPSFRALENAGCKVTSLELSPHNQVWRLLSAGFLHTGLIHIFFNLSALWSIGYRFEVEYGVWKFALVAVLCCISGYTMSSIFLPTEISCGLSGVLFGFLCTGYGDVYHNWHLVLQPRQAMLRISGIVFVLLLFGLSPLFDNFVHFGGAIVGTLCSFILLGHDSVYALYKNEKVIIHRDRVRLLCLVILTVYFVGIFIILFGGVDISEECKWCQYLSCIDTPLWSCEDYRQTFIRK